MGKKEKKLWKEPDMTDIHRGKHLHGETLKGEPSTAEMEAQFRGKGKKVNVKI